MPETNPTREEDRHSHATLSHCRHIRVDQDEQFCPGPPSGSRSWAEAVASAVRVEGGGDQGGMPGERSKEVGHTQARALRDLARPACMPCLSLGRHKPRHAVMWRGDSPHARLEDSLVPFEGAPVMLPASAPHQRRPGRT
ncbi:hypothetical protein CGC20_25365 [Leishmania donovani]|uniref:Uncharacterized protein n=1 Tax=Leishmania donovani TaxID=5661 RepID=A0A504XXL1_LEIDO|nr:hypothetical protein CGC20_25365 [Leishmania donovani]